MSGVRTARHARPGVLSRPYVRKAALATGAIGVLAVPVSATLIAESPLEASAAARNDRILALAALAPVVPAGVVSARLTDAASTTDAAVGRQMASAAMDVAAQQAAERAAAAQVAADQAAVQQRAADEQAAQDRASRSRTTADLAGSADVVAPSGDPRSIARSMLAARGEGADQFSCLNSLWTKESGWSTTADNASSSAYGIPQALPGSKMASAGADWRTNAATQISWGLTYIEGRYGSPCAAWGHSRSYNWY